MTGPTSTETQERPVNTDGNEVVYLPKQETDWRNGIVQHVQSMPEVGTSFTAEHATPDTVKHVPDSEALREVKAERVGAEPLIDIKDVNDVASSALGTIGGAFGTDEATKIRTTKKLGQKNRPAILTFIKRSLDMEKAA